MKTLLSILGFLTVLTFAPIEPAWAQTDTEVAMAETKAGAQESASDEADQENIEASKGVVGVYAVLFLGVFGYLIFLTRRQANLAQAMAQLSQHVSKVESSS